MLTDLEFMNWCDRFNLPEQGQKLLEEIRSSEPVRREGGGDNNTYGFYSSKKMRKTIGFESGTVEAPGIEQFYEYSDDVLEFYNQPYRFTLKYESKSGRLVSPGYTPDFCVVRRDSVGIEEWKPEQKLLQLAEEQPNRYYKDEHGQWRSPPAEEVIQRYGFYYRIRTDTEINWVKVSNIRCLRAYWNKEYPVSSEIADAVSSIVAACPEGISLTQLRQEASEATTDDIYALLAKGVIWFDDAASSLTDDQERVRIFSSSQVAEACVLIQQTQTSSLASTLQITDLIEGTNFYWGGKLRTIVHIGEGLLFIRGDNNLIRLSYADFHSLIQQGDIAYPKKQTAEAFSDKVRDILLQASPADYEEANRRYWIIAPELHGQSPNEDTPARTRRAYKANYKTAEAKYGLGFIGLLPQENPGNHYSRYSQEVWDFVDHIIATEYENGNQPNRLAAYGILLAKWEEEEKIGEPPSYQAFCKRIKHRPLEQQVFARQGKRAAYQVSPIYWEVDYKTPRHGSRPFENCHIDHTEEDIEVICPRTGRNLGRPWTTVLIDAYSRRILAVYMCFDPPSYRSCMMVLRICVQRHNRFPETIIVDNGKEFLSTYFDTFLAAFGCHKKHRPAGKPRFGSIIERFFGTSHTQFFYNLRGNTQITKFVRIMTKSHDPKLKAIWVLDELYEHYAFGYCYGFYDEKTHPALGQSPKEAFDSAMLNTGSRPQQFIKYNEAFIILSLPSTRKGTVKVQVGRGVKINGFWYGAKDGSFNHQGVEGTQVAVRYNPFDLGEAFAYVLGKWVRCISEHYSTLRGRTEKELQIYSAEKRQEKRKYGQELSDIAKGNAIRFLASDRPSEKQALQRQRDLSQREVHQVIDGDHTKPLPLDYGTAAQVGTSDNYNGTDALDCELVSEIDLTDIEPYEVNELWEM
ncbi:DDE-type integrase/transposase/recombinase [Leptolyngbya sp. AN03gr2]|uniref:DDE-type integrase/transposase/recombinase n=1 Tax=unclassified Leptolyngbya TaxID=2650499 RepID=UPI003D31E25E